jgi:hypothetical protein
MLNTPVRLSRKDIDSQRWDAAVASSPRASLYGYSYTLDHLCDNWDGLVLGDYEVVMPIPWGKKFGIRYGFTPPFIQRLDIYGKVISDDHVRVFNAIIPSLFSYANLDLAFAASDLSRLRRRINYIKDLSPGYSVIHSSYMAETHRSLRKAAARNCVLGTEVTIADVVNLYRAAYGSKSSIRPRDLEKISTFAAFCNSAGHLLLRSVRDSASGELLFGALLFLSSNRIYYLLGAPTPKGRTARAGYFLVDGVMKEFAGTNNLFDFEGSDIPSVASFYEKFNPSAEIYYHLDINRLPWPLRLFKK